MIKVNTIPQAFAVLAVMYISSYFISHSAIGITLLSLGIYNFYAVHHDSKKVKEKKGE